MTQTNQTWRRTRSEQIADCKVFNVRSDYSINSETGLEAKFYCIESPAWVNIIPVTITGEVVLIEQYRHGIEEITLEIPGGMVDDGEDFEIAAKRELIEETGYTPREIISLGKSRPNPAINDNWIYHFLALECEKTHEPDFDETEHAIVKLFALDEIPQLIRDEKITHSLVLAGFYKYWLHSLKI